MPNNKVLQFHSVEKPVTIQPSVLFEDEDLECMTMLKEDSDTLMQIFDGAVAEITKEAGLSGLHFAMDESSYSDIARQMQDGMLGCFNVLYHAKKGDIEYMATVTVIMDGVTEVNEDGMEGISYSIISGLYRFQDNEVWCFDNTDGKNSEGKWENDKDETEKFRILEEDGAEADFIYCISDYMGFSAESISGGFVTECLKDNKKLIGLYKMMHGLADFDFDIEQKTGMEINIKTFLVPDDMCRCGGTVYYDKGEFHVCQRLLPEDDEEACCTGTRFLRTLPDGTKGYQYNPRDHFLEVYKDSNAKNIQKCLMFCWDHYSPDLTFNFPLSAHAYAESRNPYSHLRVYTQYGKRDLTKPEENNLKALKKFFNLNSKNSPTSTP